jgi:hypothetical protein
MFLKNTGGHLQDYTVIAKKNIIHILTTVRITKYIKPNQTYITISSLGKDKTINEMSLSELVSFFLMFVCTQLQKYLYTVFTLHSFKPSVLSLKVYRKQPCIYYNHFRYNLTSIFSHEICTSSEQLCLPNTPTI